MPEDHIHNTVDVQSQLFTLNYLLQMNLEI